jgi:hypothetical protein
MKDASENESWASGEDGLARTYAHPGLVRRLAMSGILLSTATFVALTAVAVAQPERIHGVLLAACLATLAVCLVLSVRFVRRSRDTIVVDDTGLWWHSPHRETLGLAWEDIAKVEPQNVMQRLVVSDASGRRRIALEYHLENFGELRRTVIERAAGDGREDGAFSRRQA